MIYGLYLSTAGAKAQSWRQDIVANNVANVDTTGFRKQFAVMQKRASRQVEFGMRPPFAPSDPRNMEGGLHMFHIPSAIADQFDHITQGTMKNSKNLYDLAVHGQGFFVVRKGDETLLTRKGSFSVDLLGNMVTDDGSGNLMTTDGNPIRIDPTVELKIFSDGTMYQAGRPVGQISISSPVDMENISRRPGTMFAFEGELQNAPGRVLQGSLESSNVEPILEMVELIESARAFEMNINMIQLQDQTLGTFLQNVPRLQ